MEVPCAAAKEYLPLWPPSSINELASLPKGARGIDAGKQLHANYLLHLKSRSPQAIQDLAGKTMNEYNDRES
jgi:hypothetical protein